MALFFLVFSAISRASQTLGVDFGPSRVQAQAFLLFAVTVAIAANSLGWHERIAQRLVSPARRIAAVGVAALIAALAVASSTQLLNLADRGAQLPDELASSGENVQRLITPQDVDAAKWLSAIDRFQVSCNPIDSVNWP